jgi:hypothetical protein
MRSFSVEDLGRLVRPSVRSSTTELLDAVVGLQTGKVETLAKICAALTKDASDSQVICGVEQLTRGASCLAALDLKRRRAVCLHPSFNYWLNGLQRLVLERDFEQAGRWGLQLANFLWPEAHAEIESRAWMTLLDDRGGMRCLAGRSFVEFGVKFAGCPLTITPGREGVQFKVGNEVPVTVARVTLESGGVIADLGTCISLQPTIGNSQIECSSRDEALRVVWRDAMNRSRAIDFFGSTSDIYPPSIDLEPYDAALRTVETTWPEAATELSLITKVVVPTDSGAEQRRAATLPSRNGAIYVDLDDPMLMEEALLHEHAHIKLRYLQYFDPLMRNFDDETLRVPVPWRSDPRPLPGIFEGVFVYSHVAEYAVRRSRDGLSGPAARGMQLADWVRYGLDVLAQHGQFSPMGVELLNQIAAWNLELRRLVASAA